jgi:hypothetical protein
MSVSVMRKETDTEHDVRPCHGIKYKYNMHIQLFPLLITARLTELAVPPDLITCDGHFGK